VDFFEALRQKSEGKLYDEWHQIGDGPTIGIDATIETLKEMMVGEPIPAIVEIQVRGIREKTWIKAHPMKISCDAEVCFSGWQAPMDEKVTVMVFGDVH